MECWTTLSALSSDIKNSKIGTLVLNNLLRYPSILAKMAATLDVISGGRLEFGIGAGDQSMEQECLDFGINFPNTNERIERLKEAIHIIKEMWIKDSCSYKGKYYSVRNAMCFPKPIQKPHPPIWIGGISKKTLHVVAELADGCNFWGISPDECEHRLKILKQLCLLIGRNYQEILKSWAGEIILAENEEELKRKIKTLKPGAESKGYYFRGCIMGTPEQCIEKIKAYVKVGVTYFVIYFLDADLHSLQIFAENVLPAFKRS